MDGSKDAAQEAATEGQVRRRPPEAEESQLWSGVVKDVLYFRIRLDVEVDLASEEQ